MLNDIANRIVNSSDIKNLLSRDYSSTETQTIIGYLLKKIVVLEDKFEEIQKVLKIDIQSEETCISRKRPSIARNEQDLFKLEKLSIQKLPETKEEIKKVEKLEEEQSSETNIFVSKASKFLFQKKSFLVLICRYLKIRINEFPTSQFVLLLLLLVKQAYLENKLLLLQKVKNQLYLVLVRILKKCKNF